MISSGKPIEDVNVNSDLWMMENLASSTFINRSGDACDSYHRFAQDICVLKAIGLNTYRQIRDPGEGKALPSPLYMPFVDADDRGEVIKQPLALHNTVEYAHQRSDKPVFVTENGLESDIDDRRAWYIPQALAGLLEAIAQGVRVIGYLPWSLIDNSEWQRGYGPKLGLARANLETFVWTLKPSTDVYRRIVRANTV